MRSSPQDAQPGVMRDDEVCPDTPNSYGLVTIDYCLPSALLLLCVQEYSVHTVVRVRVCANRYFFL